MKYFTWLMLGIALGGCLRSWSAAVVTAERDQCLILSNPLVQLELNRADFSLRQLTDLESGTAFVAEAGGGLFAITGYVPDQAAAIWYVTPPGVTVDAKSFSSFQAEAFQAADEGGWRLYFRDAPFGDATLDVLVTVTLAADSALLRWNIAVDNRSTTALQQVQFPIFSGLGSDRPNAAATDYMAAPLYSGARMARPREQITAAAGQSEYPGSGQSIQLLTYCDGQGGALYFASHDAANYRKTFVARPDASKQAFTETIIHYADDPAAPGRWTLAYPVLWGPIAGDWYDAAKRYRAWAIQQPRWKQSLAERELPEWFRQLPVWFQGNQWADGADAMLEFADRIVAVRDALGCDIGFHWYIWQRYLAHDYNYPDYLPARPGFAEAVKRVQASGVKVMPYLNIHLCETQLPIWDDLNLAQAAKVDSTGQLYRGYGVGGAFGAVTDTEEAPVDVFRGEQQGRDMVPMCLTEPVWQELMVGIADRLLAEYGVDAIYYDETYVFPGICFSRSHRHPWFGGTHHADSVEAIHAKTKELRPEGVVTTGENLGECYINVCDALINAHSDMQPGSLPIFQTVYADRVTEIGCFVNQAELSSPAVFASKLGFMLTRGRQLGWFNSDQQLLRLTEPEFAAQLALLRAYCDVRMAGTPWLFEGELLRAPEIPGIATVTQRWDIWPDYQQKVDFPFPVVYSAMFRAPDGELGLILCNLTDTEQSVVIPWNFRDWGLTPNQSCRRRDYVDGHWQPQPDEEVATGVAVTVPAWTPMITALKPVE